MKHISRTLSAAFAPTLAAAALCIGICPVARAAVSTSALQVVDANGVVVGRLGSGPTSYFSAYLTINGAFTAFPLQYGANTLALTYMAPPYAGIQFSDVNCTGTAYLTAYVPGVVASFVVKKGAKYILYTASAIQAVADMPTASFVDGSGLCTNQGGTVTGFPATFHVDVTAKWALPFSVR